jgi:uncharacterized iron-regulated membrane protein
MPVQGGFSLASGAADSLRESPSAGLPTLNFQIRNTVLQAHRWAGLTVGLVLIYVALTGLTMLFRPQLEPLVERGLREVSSCVARLPADALVRSAREVHPGGRIRQLEIADGGFGATVVRFDDLVGVYVDPCNGAILGQRDRWGGVFGMLEYLHRYRFVGNTDVSETIAGSVAFTLVLMVLGGIVAWWPASLKAAGKSLKLRPKLKGRAFEINLHRTYGMYVALVLLATAGAALTFTFDWARGAVYAIMGSPPPERKPVSAESGGTVLPLETFLARTLAMVPDAGDITLINPGKPGAAVEIIVIERAAPHPNARTMLFLDAHTGGVLRFEPYAASSPGHKVYRWLASLHMGYIGGVFGQLVLLAAILGIPILGYTGIRSYLRGRATAKQTFRKKSA